MALMEISHERHFSTRPQSETDAQGNRPETHKP